MRCTRLDKKKVISSIPKVINRHSLLTFGARGTFLWKKLLLHQKEMTFHFNDVYSLKAWLMINNDWKRKYILCTLEIIQFLKREHWGLTSAPKPAQPTLILHAKTWGYDNVINTNVVFVMSSKHVLLWYLPLNHISGV